MFIPISILAAVLVLWAFRRWLASSRRSAAAFNVLLGKHTFLQLPPEWQSRVEERANQILHEASRGRISGFNGEIDRYGWYALAMNELGIPPAVRDYPKWNAVSNPFFAIMPNDPYLDSASSYIKRQFGIEVDVSREYMLFDSISKAENIQSNTSPVGLPYLTTVMTMTVKGGVDEEIVGHSVTAEMAKEVLKMNVDLEAAKYASLNPRMTHEPDGTVMLHTEEWSKVFRVIKDDN